jgi:UTP--glucose-1-phosphate uridylyltransferase
MDNLAASMEPWILGLLDSHGIDFLLEVTDRTQVDRKGGTLIVRNGGLDLLEIGQVSPIERSRFMDIEEFRVFNTNNVWVDLQALSDAMKAGGLRMPVIRNPKTVEGTRVFQLETAMGSAVGCFPRARGLRVGRDRFFPTKKVEDLFLLQSDACSLDSMYRVRRNPARAPALPLRPFVTFGSDFLDSPSKMGFRFEDPSTVSLVDSISLEVHGPAFFEADVRIAGRVMIHVPSSQGYRIKRGSTLQDGRYP